MHLDDFRSQICHMWPIFIHTFCQKVSSRKKKNKQIAFYMHLQKKVFLCILVSKIENRGKRAIKMSELKRKMAWPIWYLWSEHRTHFEYILKGTGTKHMKNCNIRLTASIYMQNILMPEMAHQLISVCVWMCWLDKRYAIFLKTGLQEQAPRKLLKQIKPGTFDQGRESF